MAAHHLMIPGECNGNSFSGNVVFVNIKMVLGDEENIIDQTYEKHISFFIMKITFFTNKLVNAEFIHGCHVQCTVYTLSKTISPHNWSRLIASHCVLLLYGYRSLPPIGMQIYVKLPKLTLVKV